MTIAELEGQCPLCTHHPFSDDWKLRAHLRARHHGSKEQLEMAPDTEWEKKKSKRRGGQKKRGKDIR